MFKKVKPFLATFESEKEFTEVLENKNEGGLGLEFGFPENAKDKSKSKLWRLYFQGKIETMNLSFSQLTLE